MSISVTPSSRRRWPVRFVLLVFALSLPFWALGAMTARQLMPRLPVSALMAVCPLLAALLLAARERGARGVRELLRRAWDLERIINRAWLAPVLLLVPAIALLSYALMRLLGMPLPTVQLPVWAIPGLALAFLVGACPMHPGTPSARLRSGRDADVARRRSDDGTVVRIVGAGEGIMARIAINGLGRIGRAFLKLAVTRPELEVVAVNDLADPANLAYLIRFDSVYGRFDEPVEYDESAKPTLVVGARRIRFLQQRDPAQLPWAELAVDVVVEATGILESYQKAKVHLTAGARRVVLTAPAKDADGPDARTVLVGVNLEALAGTPLTSNGSCTTNSASPVLQVLQDSIGIRKAMLNTVHGYTATQSLIDAPAKGADMRRGRAAAVNIVPASTGAAIAVTRAMPSLTGRFDGVAMRVPVVVGSLSAIVFLASRPTSADEINTALEQAARQPRWQRVLAVTREQVVSTDIVGNPHAAIVDLSLTKVVDGDLCSVYSWYDNEFGYANSLLEHVAAVAARLDAPAGAGASAR